MEYFCNICNKKYASYKSLWKHNKSFHSEMHINITEKDRNFQCEKCNKKFTRKDNLKNHIENTCKNNKQNDNKDDKIILLENEIKTLKESMEELKKSKSNNIINNNTTNNNNSNNTTNIINNNIYINKIGEENIHELNNYEIDEIFNTGISCVAKLIKHLNFNERLPNNHSFCATSLEGKYMLEYNVEENKINRTRKKYFYQELLIIAIHKLEKLYKIHKKSFPKDKCSNIEDNIIRLKELSNSNFSNKILKEIKNKFIEVSYNYKDVVLDTWKKSNINDKLIEDDISYFIKNEKD